MEGLDYGAERVLRQAKSQDVDDVAAAGSDTTEAASAEAIDDDHEDNGEDSEEEEDAVAPTASVVAAPAAPVGPSAVDLEGPLLRHPLGVDAGIGTRCAKVCAAALRDALA